MKKKLEGTYIPDKHTRKEKVVLGLFGLDSMVTLYLLKIQKYDLFAVTIVNSWDEVSSDQGDFLSCHLSQPKIETLKEFCHKLNIPLQVIKASAEFKEDVIEPWLADKIQGRRPKPCWNCHDLRIRTLYQKMKETGAKYFATGHYAKLFHNEVHDSVFVHTSSDEQFDQSAYLSRLPHDVLASLLLPLSDLTKKEVLKLAENFGIQGEKRKIQVNECLKTNPEIAEVVAKKIPKKLVKEGEITNPDGSSSYGQHEGVHLFTFGEPVEVKDSTKQFKGVVSGYSYSDKRILVSEAEHFMRDKLMLVNCKLSEEVSWLEPLKGFVILKDNKAYECWLFSKTLSTVSIELTEKIKLIPGEVVSVVKKKGKNSKVFLTGEIQLLVVAETNVEGEQNVPKVDPILDF